MLSQPGKVKARLAEKGKGEEEMAVYDGAEKGRAWVQGCCVSPTLDDFSALELGSGDHITQAPLSSVFQLALVNGWQLQEMKRKEERETCMFTPPDSCWLCRGLGLVLLVDSPSTVPHSFKLHNTTSSLQPQA